MNIKKGNIHARDAPVTGDISEGIELSKWTIGNSGDSGVSEGDNCGNEGPA